MKNPCFFTQKCLSWRGKSFFFMNVPIFEQEQIGHVAPTPRLFTTQPTRPPSIHSGGGKEITQGGKSRNITLIR
jgi:hypothetical protein